MDLELLERLGIRSPMISYHQAKKRAGGARNFTVEYDAFGGIARVTPHGDERRAVAVSPARPSRTSTSTDRLAAIREDGAAMRRQYRGDVWALVDDPARRIRRCELAHDSTIRDRMRSSGNPDATAPGIWGYVRRDAQGYVILISRSCPREERWLTVLHEVGHVRAFDLFDDGSEAAAIAWTRGWLAAG